MSRADAGNDRAYQVTMSMARKLLSDGVLSERQYRDFDTKMQEKYRPVFGDLFWGYRQKRLDNPGL